VRDSIVLTFVVVGAMGGAAGGGSRSDVVVDERRARLDLRAPQGTCVLPSRSSERHRSSNFALPEYMFPFICLSESPP
jgi:hypothetical protein